MKEFKVLISIEEVDEDNDVWETRGEPMDLAKYDTLEEAEAFLSSVYDSFWRHKND